MAYISRRRFELANREYSNVDLRDYKDIIIDTILDIAPDANPVVTESYYEINELPQHQRVAIGRALAKVQKLGKYCKKVEQARLFQGHLLPEGYVPDDKAKKKGGHQ